MIATIKKCFKCIPHHYDSTSIGRHTLLLLPDTNSCSSTEDGIYFLGTGVLFEVILVYSNMHGQEGFLLRGDCRVALAAHWLLLCAEALMEAGSSFINTRGQPRSQSKKSINSREYSKQAALRLCVCGYL